MSLRGLTDDERMALVREAFARCPDASYQSAAMELGADAKEVAKWAKRCGITPENFVRVSFAKALPREQWADAALFAGMMARARAMVKPGARVRLSMPALARAWQSAAEGG